MRRRELSRRSSPRWSLLGTAGQLVIDHLQGSRNRRRAALVALRAMRLIGDPPVSFTIGSNTLCIPLSHDLPVYCTAYPGYSNNLIRLATCVAEHHPHFVVIDVGANVGDSLASLRTVGDFPVLCVEPEPTYARYLEINAERFANVEVAQVALDESARDGVALTKQRGTASLDRATSGLVPVRSLDEILEDWPAFARPSLLKIDTDGSDFSVLRGAARLMRAVQPIVFLEWDPAFFTWAEARILLDWLCSLGYRSLLFWDNAGDFLIRVATNEADRVRDLTGYYSGRGSNRYCDVAIFADRDERICNAVYRNETALAERRATSLGQVLTNGPPAVVTS